MTAPPTQIPDARELRDLLLVVPRDPLRHLQALRAAREAIPGDPGIQRALDRAELASLLREASRLPSDASLGTAVAAAQAAARTHALRSLLASDPADPVALFELAELRATCLAQDCLPEAEEVGVALRARAERIGIDQRLIEIARERCTALTTEEEELALAHRVAWLRETIALLRMLAPRERGKRLVKLARRLEREAQDRELARRLERVLGRRGAWLLENLSLALLLVLFVLLGVDLLLPLDETTRHRLLIIDGAICMFFVLEFCFKLALAPRRALWFARYAITDLLPAVPGVLLLAHVALPLHSGDTVALRVLRFLRIAYFARFVQALLPLVRIARLLLLLVRGLDGLVHRFAPQLNRDFVFFEPVRLTLPKRAPDQRALLFAALRCEHVLVADLPWPQRAGVLTERAGRLAERLAASPPDPARPADATPSAREVPVEELIETLHHAKPEQLGLWLPRADIDAIDRVVRVLSAPLVRSLPLVRRVALRPLPATPEERVVAFGKRIAAWLERWHERMLFVADMHGILTGPQVLDRLATAMISASQRPAVRLLFFGALFLVVRALLGAEGVVGQFLQRFVATPLLLFGGVCMVFLTIGRWFRRIAGEATEMLKRTSEAQFIALLELQKARHQETDLAFLARRVFRTEAHAETQAALRRAIRQLRDGVIEPGAASPPHQRQDQDRVALLYLHFLDGAILHATDIKTTEQLLANLSLENIRIAHLGFTRRDRRRLKRLTLVQGSLFAGPYLWFLFITESVALETAKRVIDYNRNCLTLAQRRSAPAARIAQMEAWIKKREAEMAGRTLERTEPLTDTGYVTTDFNALDFLAAEPERDQHVQSVFGPEVLAVLRADRRAMIREIFGTRALGHLPRSRRTLNFYRLYRRWLSGGRILLLPIVFMGLALRGLVLSIQRTTGIVREILFPELARRRHKSGTAPFAVALRKIHRMKAPGLLEAVQMRVGFDPEYLGVPATWSGERRFDATAELECDLDFLHLPERDRETLHALAERVRAHALRFTELARGVPSFAEVPPSERESAERAATIAYVTNQGCARTLWHAEEWWAQVQAAPPRAPARRLLAMILWFRRGGAPHRVDAWLARHELTAPARLRAALRRGYRAGGGTRAMIDAWRALPPKTSPRDAALARLREAYRNHHELSRELVALRAVQSLSVLDVRNYREIVFRVGDYAADGEDPSVATVLP